MHDTNNVVQNQDLQPPHDEDAEKAVLGAMLIEQEAATKIFAILDVAQFYKIEHQCIFSAMQRLVKKGSPIDTITLTDELKKSGKLESVGGSYYLTELASRVPSAANVEYHARIVLEKAKYSKQIELLKGMLANRCNGADEMEYSSLRDTLNETAIKVTAGNEKPVPLSQIDGESAVSWLWHGYLTVNHITLFSGLWKAGKTTLLAYLLRNFEVGGDLGGKVEPTKILVVSEESKKLWARRRDDLRLGDHVQLFSRPIKARPNHEQWESFVSYLSKLVKESCFGLVVFDTISSLWPVKDENDATQVLTALMPLHRITEAGAALLLIHHPRKGDAAEGQAARGSGALSAFVDIILEMRRFIPENRQDKRRVLTAYSRFDETPPEIVIELTDSGYRTVGTKSDAKQCDRLDIILGLLSADLPGKTSEEVLSVWPEDCGITKPGKRTIEGDLTQGEKQKLWIMEGAGRKGDPYRFKLSDSIHAAKECEPARIEFQEQSQPLDSIPARSFSNGARNEFNGNESNESGTPDRPNCCYTCGKEDFWLSGNQWICSKCHPNPNLV